MQPLRSIEADPRVMAAPAPEGGPVRLTSGHLHYADQARYLVSRGGEVAAYAMADDALLNRFEVPSSTRGWPWVELANRVIRRGVHHALPYRDGWLACFDRSLGLFDAAGGLRAMSPLVGKRPLRICRRGELLLYGEYQSNPERRPVRVMVSSDGERWEELLRLGGVRHVHSVIWDPFDEGYLICTGDDDHECRIYRLSADLKDLELLLWGSQEARAIAVVPTATHLLFGTDTPLETNRLRAWDRRTGRIEELAEVDGSVFWGCDGPRGALFSTACEPSTVNTARQASLYQVDAALNVTRLATFAKDPVPMKLGQYGQLRLPFTEGAPPRVLFSTFAVRPHAHVHEHRPGV
ncbi:MAG TPA: hypothetical protein VD929_05295 [Caulobacteraceae bacterium]|nr:hypothetical protein [Caulobacteraceae bacterium]